MFGRLSIAGFLRLMLIVIAAALIGIQSLRWEQRTVFVFATAVEPGTSITAEMLTTASFPKAASFPGLVDDPADIVGSVASVSIPANIPLQKSFFSARCNPVGLGSDPRFPYATIEDLPKRKIPLPVDYPRQTAGLVGIGDYVDIAWAPPSQGQGGGAQPQFLLQRVHVIGLRTPDGGDAAASRGGGLSLPFSGGGGVEISHIVIAIENRQFQTLLPLSAALIYIRADSTQPLMPDVPVASTSYTQTCAEDEIDPLEPTPSPGSSESPAPSPSSSTDASLPAGWSRVALFADRFSIGLPKTPTASSATGSTTTGSNVSIFESENDKGVAFRVASATPANGPGSIDEINAMLRIVIDEQARLLDLNVGQASPAQIAGRAGMAFDYTPKAAGGFIGRGQALYLNDQKRWILWVAIVPPGNTVGLTEEAFITSARVEVQ